MERGINMTDLQRALYQFAQENRVYSLLHTGRQELWEGQKLVQEARAGLCALGDEAAGLAEKMEDGMLLGFSIEQEAVFLAGLAMGLELGRGYVFRPASGAGGSVCRPLRANRNISGRAGEDTRPYGRYETTAFFS